MLLKRLILSLMALVVTADAAAQTPASEAHAAGPAQSSSSESPASSGDWNEPAESPHEQAVPASRQALRAVDDRRSLAAPSARLSPTSQDERPKLLDIDLSDLPVDPVTTAAALTLVVGLFLLTVTTLRRAAPKSQRVLPGEVAAVLGRVSLGGKQMAHLLKLGNKLVLVHVTPDEVKTLTEVTDPAEVTQLLALCEQETDHSATNAFRDVFEKLASEPSRTGFLDEPSPLVDRQRLADAYSNTPGGRGV